MRKKRGKISVKRAIVLAGDNGYMEKLEVTIKSIVATNSQIIFYVINDNLPQEWFWLMGRRLESVQSQIRNIKISSDQIKGYSLPMDHLSYATFYRYFIADVVTEDRALYLDSDIVVTGDLTPLFEEDIENNALATVTDGIDASKFNAGVLLVNTALWREEKASHQLLELTNRYHQEEFGDQGILNRHFKGRWKKLPEVYNVMVGMDTFAHTFNVPEWYDKADQLEKDAVIIHYAGEKPWYQWNLNRCRDIWWFYHGLEWSEILLRKDITKRHFKDLVGRPKFQTAVFTNSAAMEHIETFVEAFPNVQFNILAYTNFAPSVIALEAYSNVSLYPRFTRYNAQAVLDKLDFYLDINYHEEIYDIIQKVTALRKPIFSFDVTNHCEIEGDSNCFHVEDIDDMIAVIQEYLAQLS